MLHWAIIFLIVALIAGALGFTNVAGAAAQVSRVLFYIFLVIFMIAIIFTFAGI